MLWLYAFTMFFSAVLLFAVQPLFARMALPLLGGSPSVWNTALVFYQATLLAGYLYAHISTRLLNLKRQATLHVLLLLAPLLVLPIGIGAHQRPPTDANPIPWLFGLLAAIVGLPFFAVSTTAPLLQQWFGALRQRSSPDPYFLYAASNAGSFLALLSYPLVVERLLPLSVQGHWWTIGYVVFIALVGACAIAVWRAPDAASSSTPAARPVVARREWLARRGRWLALTLIPSSLMVAVTTHVSAELAAVPLLWIVPLSIYLLTFVLVFARRPPPHRLFVRTLPITAVVVTFVFATKASEPLGFVLAMHFVMLFVGAMVCHGELARDRPRAGELTEFYLWMAAGGVLGGMFNALIAPLVFDSIIEYPLMIVAALLVAPLGGGTVRTPAVDQRLVAPGRLADVAFAAALGILTLGLALAMEVTPLTARTESVLAFGVPSLIAFGFSRRSLRYALAIGAILIVSWQFDGSPGYVVHSERTFFGLHRVTIDSTTSYRQLLHGRTIHGKQSLDVSRRHEPVGYYSEAGPLGQIFRSLAPRPARVAVLGLGNGTTAAYALPGEEWTFFEIDPAVERIARNAQWFTYLADSAGSLRVVLGDGRLSLGASTDRYDIIILDAYSSEAIPSHLLSREALQVYLARLAPHGLIVFHISNRHFNLTPVVAALARDAALVSRVTIDAVRDELDLKRGSAPSEWAIVARDVGDLKALSTDPRWQDVGPTAGTVWTDDHSSVLSALR